MSPSFDVASVLAVQQMIFATPWMSTVAIFCARWLIVLVVCSVCAMVFSRSLRLRHAVREVFWSVCIAIILATSLSTLFLRPRPFVAHPDVRLLIPIPYNTSFPSGHTATAVAIACAVFVADPFVGGIAIVLAAFVAMGRIAVGVHYPSDIVGGIIIGLFSYALVRAGHYAVRRNEIAHASERRRQNKN